MSSTSMSSGSRRLRWEHAAVLAAIVALGWSAAPAAAQEQAQYVGDATCTTCHEEAVEHYSKTVHAKVLNELNAPNALALRGCEACHGPGSLHVEAGGGIGTGGPEFIQFGSTDRKEIARENAQCLKCHDGGNQRYWLGSPHESRGNSCGSCHQVMKQVSFENLLKAENQTETCSSCHLVPRAQQLRNYHMPARQGPPGMGGENWMDCGSCHNPHGTVADSLIAANTINENCYSCHAEKRGPWLWEHAPVNESCLNCHVPHGSIKPHMLKLEPPRLCQTCHIESLHPSETRDANSRFVVGKQCMHCHQKVHGSNHPSGSFFTR